MSYSRLPPQCRRFDGLSLLARRLLILLENRIGEMYNMLTLVVFDHL